MSSVAKVAWLKYTGNPSSGWWISLGIRPPWEFALSRCGEVVPRPESVRVEILAKALDAATRAAR